MKDSIQRLLEIYMRELEEIEQELPEHPLCNSFIKGKWSAYSSIVKDLVDLLEGDE